VVPTSTAPPFLRLAGHPVRWRLLAELSAGDLRVRELVGLLGRPQNLVSYHLRLLREADLVTTRRSSFDGRDSYYHLDLDRCAALLAGAGGALHPALQARLPTHPPGVPERPASVRVLFACTGNTARSPIAEALLRLRTGGTVDVTSAGSHPGERIHPGAVRVLGDDFGVDISGQRPRHLESVAGQRFDLVVTLCDRVREVCPEFPGHPGHSHWSIPDPAPGGATGRAAEAAVRRTAREIDRRVHHLLHVVAGPARKEGARP
jgi:protein-tyrosine-phosphatase/DNA-binding transcriptional ArsR family regulator